MGNGTCALISDGPRDLLVLIERCGALSLTGELEVAREISWRLRRADLPAEDTRSRLHKQRHVGGDSTTMLPQPAAARVDARRSRQAVQRR